LTKLLKNSKNYRNNLINNMKYKGIPVRLFIPVGLLLVVLPIFINTHFVALPDFFQGMLTGMGIALELTGFILLRRKRISACKALPTDGE